jgi:hypothetical protein
VTNLRAWIRQAPGGEAAAWVYRLFRYRLKTRRQVFTTIYRENSWGSDESVSGTGSTLEYTKNLRARLPALFTSLRVHRLLDAPCGDYHWCQFVDRGAEVDYLGIDVVEALITTNQQRYGNVGTAFRCLDIVSDPLPSADLWLCRDLLCHLCDRDIGSLLANLERSDIRYLLTTSHAECTRNRDTHNGGFRALNLRLAPFFFPEPIFWIDDWIEGFPVRKLGLWEVSALTAALASNPLVRNGARRSLRVRRR